MCEEPPLSGCEKIPFPRTSVSPASLREKHRFSGKKTPASPLTKRKHLLMIKKSLFFSSFPVKRQ